MAKLQLNLPETAGVKSESPKIELRQAGAPEPEIKPLGKENSKVWKQKIPCENTIVKLGEGRIRATNAMGDFFEGKTEDFNKLLRG